MLILTAKFAVPASRQKALDREIISPEEFDQLNTVDAADLEIAVRAALVNIAEEFKTSVEIRL